MSDTKKLFSEFQPISTPEWEEKIKQDLKGADYAKKLIWRTMEGAEIKPYYRSEHLEDKTFLESWPGDFPYLRGTSQTNDWYIRQDIIVEDAASANKKALEVLNKGVTSLGFIIEGNKSVDLSILLNDICISAIELNFIVGETIEQLAESLVSYLNSQGDDKNALFGSIQFAPITSYMNGKEVTIEKDIQICKSLIEQFSAFPNFKVISVDGLLFRNSGSNLTQELAISLSAGVEYMTQLTENGAKLIDIAQSLQFNLGVGSNYFFEIAKFRAIRLLWSKICGSYGISENDIPKLSVQAKTIDWNKTLYDPYVNMLRTTTEAMSAALGGVNSLTVAPFNETFETPTAFSERIARNQQILLKEEAYFDKVTDPAAGSYYIETLTAELIDKAWALFLEIEEKGGFLKAIQEGFIQGLIEQTAANRQKNVSTRRENFLGTNQFPNFGELVEDGISEEVTQAKPLAENSDIKQLKLFRGSQEFEALRFKTDTYSKSNKRPAAFMLTYGNLAMRKARSQFSCNFFACAGFDVVDNNGFKSVEEGIKAALDQKAEIIVLCSADDEYPVIAPQAKELLGDKAILVVAGYPKDNIEDLKAKGIGNFIHMRSNLLEELKSYQKQLNL